MKKKCVITGGGSGGHLAPVRAIGIDLQKTHSAVWMGSTDFEQYAATSMSMDFKKIYSGKMRRGKSLSNFKKNVVDFFKLKLGFAQSFIFLVKNRPDFVFSTGGFVSVPVVLAAWVLRIPIYIHEQTIGFGLANKIASFCATKILLGFAESKKYTPSKFHSKVIFVGNPIRKELYTGSRESLEEQLDTEISKRKPLLYVTGGGQGSKLINDVVFKNIETLCQKFTLIHQTGSLGIDIAKGLNEKDYFPFEFIGKEMSDILNSVDLVLSRAGANSVNEFFHFDLYSIFVPLRPVQNDEQMKNAKWFISQKQGSIIDQDNFSSSDLMRELETFRQSWFDGKKSKNILSSDSAKKILEEITNEK